MIYRLLRPLLFRVDAESAHLITLKTLRAAAEVPLGKQLLRRLFCVPSPSLRRRVAGLDFANPVGLAAGYDKDGRSAAALACLGFGHVEVGTVTPLPQAGRPRPRVFRLAADRALINRMGFPNPGGRIVAERISRLDLGSVVLGVSLGKGVDTPLAEAATDYVSLLHLFYNRADYLAVNLSSPNTPGLRSLQGAKYLEGLLSALTEGRTTKIAESGRFVPLFVKLSPDLAGDDLDQALDILIDGGADGVIAVNTTSTRPCLGSSHSGEEGGLSGQPLGLLALDRVQRIAGRVAGRLAVIGVGGLHGPTSVRRMMDAGADLVQLYTGLVYEGPGLIPSILRDLAVNSKGPPTAGREGLHSI